MRAMFHRALPSLALVLVCTACGGKPSAHDPGTAKRGETAAASAPGARARRGASDEIKKAWNGDNLELAIYVDFDGLLKTKLVSKVLSEFLPMVTEPLSPAQETCVENALKETRELAVASSKGDMALLLARFNPAASSQIGPCITGRGNAQAATVTGAAEAWTVDDDVVAITKTGLLAYGPRALVETAIAGRGNGKGLDALSLEGSEYIAWTASVVEGDPPMKGSVLVADDRFRISAQGNAPNDAIAERIEGAKNVFARSVLSEKLPAAQAQAVKRLVDAAEIKRNGRHLEGRFELHGSTEQMAVDLGTGSTLAIYAVRQYLLRAKQSEATHTVAELARILSQDGAKKKLVSYPPTPKEVPKGAKYASTPADWKPWAPLHFQMTEPQYYQYEIKAAKDGKSADIIARGDLNGDGTTSEFKLTVKVGPDGRLVIPPTVTETNPNE